MLRKLTFGFLLPVLSGIVCGLPFDLSNLWLFCWFGFLPLFIVLENKNPVLSFLISYAAGVAFWLTSIFWLMHVTLPGMFILVLYLAVYFGIFGAIFSLVSSYRASIAVIALPCAWVILEYLRSNLLTGFPWSLLGYSQYKNTALIQIADITGAWGVSFLVMFINAALYFGIIKKKNIKFLIAAAVCLCACLAYGIFRAHAISSLKARDVKISVIQGNIKQELKWDPDAREIIMDRYLGLSRQAAKDAPSLIVWPEASLPVILEEEPDYFERVKGLEKEIRIPLLLGAVRSRQGNYYNSAILLSRDSSIEASYDKVHLVPFGEYIPLRKVFRFLETIAPIGDITPGREFTVFKGDAPFSVLICFEDLFPGLSGAFRAAGAEMLINITNDAWYKMTPAAYQHLAASVFRAVEFRLPVARAANTGVTCVIDNTGRIVSYVHDSSGSAIFNTGFITARIKTMNAPWDFYALHPLAFISLLCFFLLYALTSQRRKRDV